MSKRKIYTKEFWLDTSERVIGTTAVAAIPSAALIGTDKIDYAVAGFFVLATALGTLLKCVGAATIGDKGTASLLPAGVQEEELNG